MPTTIRLDGSALTKLLELDPNFQLELQRAVIAEITRKLYHTDVATNVRKMIEECFKEHKKDLVEAITQDEALKKQMDEKLSSLVQSIRAGSWGSVMQKKLSTELQNLMDEHLRQLVDTAVTERVGRVNNLVNEASKRIEDQVVERIGKLGGTIEHNWKVEALKVIKADVAATIANLMEAPSA